MCRQHLQSIRPMETIVGRPIAQIQQQAPSYSASCSCGDCKRTISCHIDPLICCGCRTPFHCLNSGLTRDATAADLTRNSWICRRCTMAPPQRCQDPLQTSWFVSEPTNRISQPALRTPQCDTYFIREKRAHKNPTPAFSGFSTT